MMRGDAQAIEQKGLRSMTNNEASTTTTQTAVVAEQGAQVAPEKAASKKGATQKKGAPKAKKGAKESTPKKRAKDTSKKTSKPTSTKGAKEAREGSKKAKVIEMLKREKGATNEEIQKATGWQPHTVRGFLSIAGKNLTIETIKRENGARAYHAK